MSATLTSRKALGGWTAQTSRIRLMAACTAVSQDPQLTTTRERLADLVERMHPVDPALAESLSRLLANTTDRAAPLIDALALPAILREQVY